MFSNCLCSLIVCFFILFPFTFSEAQTVYINGIPRDTSFTVYQTYIKQKKYFPGISIAEPNLPKGVTVKENIVYSKPGGKRRLHLNIYRPDDSKVYPALLMVHGGGWNSGDFSLQIPMAQQIATKGYVTIPIEYRLIPEALYPAAVHDLKAAVRWVRANAKKYGIDPNKIAISGCSAGGQLANLIGVTNGRGNYEGNGGNPNVSSKVQAVINVDGLSDFTVEESISRAKKARESGEKMPVDAIWLGGTYEERKAIWEEASPIYWVSDKSVPICFINSSIPRFHNGRDEMVLKLDSLKIYSEVHTIENTPHPFWLLNPWMPTTVNYIVIFLDKIFK